MRIKIIKDIPIDPKHGLRVGRIFEVSEVTGEGRDVKVWVIGDMGEKCALFKRELIEVSHAGSLESEK